MLYSPPPPDGSPRKIPNDSEYFFLQSLYATIMYTIVTIHNCLDLCIENEQFRTYLRNLLEIFFLANGMIEFFGPDRQKERNQKGVKTNRHEEKNQQNQTRLNSIQ